MRGIALLGMFVTLAAGLWLVVEVLGRVRDWIVAGRRDREIVRRLSENRWKI
jgi:hypothetical protein